MIKPILRWPSKCLKTPCENVFAGEIIGGLVDDLKDTLKSSGGVGLSANQIGVSKCVMVANLAQQGLKVFVNPKVIKFGPKVPMVEGCLSVPGVEEEVPRSKTVVVEYLDLLTGKLMQEEFEGRDAHVIQHECDHLDGVTFVDYLKPGKRDQIRFYLRKNRR
jgi:peptide deformylase